jgi:hypothetical protein
MQYYSTKLTSGEIVLLQHKTMIIVGGTVLIIVGATLLMLNRMNMTVWLFLPSLALILIGAGLLFWQSPGEI